MILLIVTIGLLNICLGFGLAMFYGFGPPGLDGILESFGPMPPAPPTAPNGLGEPVAVESAEFSAASSAASQPLAEEQLLGEVSDLASSAQSAVAAGAVESRG